jgi:hypothetical protein
MTLDQLIIESEVFENISSKRKKNHFLKYTQKTFKSTTIIGNHDEEFLIKCLLNPQYINIKIVPKIELIDFLDQNNLEPENIQLISYSEEYKYEAEELNIKQIYRPSNLNIIIKNIK